MPQQNLKKYTSISKLKTKHRKIEMKKLKKLNLKLLGCNCNMLVPVELSRHVVFNIWTCRFKIIKILTLVGANTNSNLIDNLIYIIIVNRDISPYIYLNSIYGDYRRSSRSFSFTNAMFRYKTLNKNLFMKKKTIIIYSYSWLTFLKSLNATLNWISPGSIINLSSPLLKWTVD